MRCLNLWNMGKITLVAAMFLAASIASAAGISVKIGAAKKYVLGSQPNVVVIGNPNIADVIIEDNRVMFVIGLSVGETSLHILNAAGSTIMRRTIHVREPSSRHVTVNRGGQSTEMTCQAGRCVNRGRYRTGSETAGAGGGGRNVSGGGRETGRERSGDLN